MTALNSLKLQSGKKGEDICCLYIIQSVPLAKGQRSGYEELKLWYEKSGLPLKKFFNTSGMLYRQMQLKDKLPAMSEDEQLELLATDGMLVKRPLIVGENRVLTGFKETEWADDLLRSE